MWKSQIQMNQGKRNMQRKHGLEGNHYSVDFKFLLNFVINLQNKRFKRKKCLQKHQIKIELKPISMCLFNV